MMSKLFVMKIRPDMPGYGTIWSERWPWLVFRNRTEFNESGRAQAFRTWQLAFKYADHKARGIPGIVK